MSRNFSDDDDLNVLQLFSIYALYIIKTKTIIINERHLMDLHLFYPIIVVCLNFIKALRTLCHYLKTIQQPRISSEREITLVQTKVIDKIANTCGTLYMKVCC